MEINSIFDNFYGFYKLRKIFVTSDIIIFSELFSQGQKTSVERSSIDNDVVKNHVGGVSVRRCQAIGKSIGGVSGRWLSANENPGLFLAHFLFSFELLDKIKFSPRVVYFEEKLRINSRTKKGS